jgi:indolepyruvate ferredoxin oxidoreductase, alpha subunit
MATTIDIDAPGKRVLMMGNEAIARGALEGGVGFASSYPGTPASEIMDTLCTVAKKMGFYAEWSVNEIVALEAAAGASMAGIPAIVSMKQDGTMVVCDFLKSGVVGVGKGGLVLVSGDDPGAHSSGNGYDMKILARWLDIPIWEPSSVQEAKDMAKGLIELSRYAEMLVMMRSVTRIGHGRGTVILGELPKNDRKAFFSDIHHTRNPQVTSYTPMPPDLKFNNLQKKLARAQEVAEKSQFNWYEGPGKPELMIVTCGGGYLYAKEAVKLLNVESRVGILKIGTVWPLPINLVKKHMDNATRILAIEEVSPFLEERLMEMASELPEGSPRPVFYGRRSGDIPIWGELNPDIVAGALKKILNVGYEARTPDYIQKVDQARSVVIPRPVSICPGCPHRASFWAMKKALKLDGRDGFVTGDIGCYFTGFNASGFFQIRTGHCMGAGVGVANGMGRLQQYGFNQPILAACGDSTFFHATIPGLINSAWNKSNFITVIMDNSATAMTGFQPHPGTGITAMGEHTRAISIEGICRAIGMRVEITDPFDFNGTVEKLLDLMRDEQSGGRVLIMRRECELIRARKAKAPYKVYVDTNKCLGDSCGCDRYCNRAFTCTGLYWDAKAGKARIDEVICAGCGYCANVCPQGAIIKEELK